MFRALAELTVVHRTPAVFVGHLISGVQIMRGWIILNGLVGVSSVSAIVSGMTSSIGIKSLSVLSLVLLGLTLITKTIRGRA